MNDYRALVGNADPALETFVAELTAAAYPIALRHGGTDKWLDLELDLWRFGETDEIDSAAIDVFAFPPSTGQTCLNPRRSPIQVEGSHF